MRLGGMATGLVGDLVGSTADLISTETDKARIHRRVAERMLRVFGEMKGLPLKAGQMLSYVNEFVPEEHRDIYADVLGRLQMHTPTLAWEDIEQVFDEEYAGQKPEDLFASFDHEPLAAASIGQVYRATMTDGTDVVVKVQYPGVADAFESDLANVEALIGTLSHLIPKVDFRHFIHDITSQIQAECDYENELMNQRDFTRCWQDDPDVVIPEVYPDLSTKRVIVSEFLPGLEWPEMLATATAEQKRNYGETIYRFVFESLFCHAMFNGDPHPGNYLFYPDGRVGFIDFGCVQRFSPEQAQGFLDLRNAILRGDTDSELFEAMVTTFTMPKDLDPEMIKQFTAYMQMCFAPVTSPQPFRFTSAYSKDLLEGLMRLKSDMNLKMIKGKKVYPIDLEHGDASMGFLGRIIFGLTSILSTLDAEADFRAIVAGLDVSKPSTSQGH